MNITGNNSIEMGFDSNQALDYLTYMSKQATVSLSEILSNLGLNASLRWTSVLLLFLSVAIIYIGIKISQPVLKWILIILSALLLIGLILPW